MILRRPPALYLRTMIMRRSPALFPRIKILILSPCLGGVTQRQTFSRVSLDLPPSFSLPQCFSSEYRDQGCQMITIVRFIVMHADLHIISNFL